MKVIQIGLGGWGKNHLRILSKLGVLTSICDSNEETVIKTGEKYKVSTHISLESLLELEKFDTAFVCTPTIHHFDIASKLINARKNVFVEKPLTFEPEQATQLVKMAKEKNVMLTCGYIERFNPAIEYVKKLIDKKSCGELLMINFHRENIIPLHVKDVGIIFDTAVHDIDTANWLFDEAPETVFTSSGKRKHDYEDFSSMMLKYSNGRSASIISNWLTPDKVRKCNVIFTDAKITVDFIAQRVEISEKDGIHIPILEHEEPLKKEIESFLGAVEHKNKLCVLPEQALLVTQIASLALKSSQENTSIKIPKIN